MKNKKIIKTKKGELTSKQLVTIIVLITSFAIIIAFFFMLNFTGIIGTQTCKNSVQMASIKIPILGFQPFKINCKTQDICLSVGNGCVNLGANTKIIKITEEEKYNKLANLMVDCWSQMGEGKLNYGKKGDCAICQRLEFDTEFKPIFYSELRITLNDLKTPDKKQTFAEYLNFPKSQPNKVEIINPGQSKEFVIVTGFTTDNSQFSPVLIDFTSEKLEQLGCTNFLTEA